MGVSLKERTFNCQHYLEALEKTRKELLREQLKKFGTIKVEPWQNYGQFVAEFPDKEHAPDEITLDGRVSCKHSDEENSCKISGKCYVVIPSRPEFDHTDAVGHFFRVFDPLREEIRYSDLITSIDIYNHECIVLFPNSPA